MIGWMQIGGVTVMAEQRKRQRPIQIKFYVNAKEKDLIKQRMAAVGTINMSGFLRKMALTGYIVHLELPELYELTSQMGRISNSENQIAKRVNESGHIYEADLEEIKKNQEQIWKGIGKILLSLSKID